MNTYLVQKIARFKKIFPTSIKMEVDGEREPGAIPALFKKINVTVILEGDILEDKAKRAVNLSFDKYCSVSKTLEHTAEISYSILLNGQKIM